ncbi:hypothetical protein BKA70DRAFT_1435360 [Coprinopsis sp. MPI-PUGE-AT-0042]|nr:hypothetical protein BKA70DRAFT_1435360 [Coprinopsis sp. MPI-PUGE-AT-0042]
MDDDGRRRFQLLRMVCSHWRAVCFSTPSFWASIAFKNEGYETGNAFYADIMCYMRRWFSRAGPSLPLSLTFEDEEQDCDEDEELIDFIQEHQKRWRYLSLDIDTKQFWKLLTVCPCNQWTNLCHLELSDGLIDVQDHDAESDISLDGHPLADHFPAVTEVAVRSYLGMSPLMYPASQNTVERLSWYSTWLETAHLGPFISKYRFLTHLCIHFARSPLHGPNIPNHVSLESLKYFSFSATQDWINWDFLGRFRTPLLSDLVLEFNDGWSDDAESRPSSVKPLFESCRNRTLTSFSLKGAGTPQIFQRILPLVLIKHALLKNWGGALISIRRALVCSITAN